MDRRADDHFLLEERRSVHIRGGYLSRPQGGKDQTSRRPTDASRLGLGAWGA